MVDLLAAAVAYLVPATGTENEGGQRTQTRDGAAGREEIRTVRELFRPNG
jgi:hypothetical protein